jgi:hypothetical protein
MGFLGSLLQLLKHQVLKPKMDINLDFYVSNMSGSLGYMENISEIYLPCYTPPTFLLPSQPRSPLSDPT